MCGVFLYARTIQIDRGASVAVGAPAFAAHLVSREGVAEQILGEPPAVAVLERGETIGSLLARLGFDGPTHRDLLVELAGTLDLRRLRPGFALVARRAADGSLVEVVAVEVGKGETILRPNAAAPNASGWEHSWRPYQRVAVPRRVAGRLETTLSEGLAAAGAPSGVTYALAEVLQWDLDFTRDLRKGDNFEVLFEEELLEGRPSGVSRILAVRYENRGRVLEAYRFGEAGYYDDQGRPLRKRFLRSPLKFTRVSSGFSRARLHPVLKVMRPHYGVDYAAPVGTPARVTANGVVSFVGWDRGGGRTVKVRHGKDYETAYLHLSRYADRLTVGQRVTQGETIGYVGATGLATGPHLDYRVRFRGSWIDPLTLGAETAEPLGPEEAMRFAAVRDQLRHILVGPGDPTSDQIAAALGNAPTVAAGT